jgi:hypothetical protein
MNSRATIAGLVFGVLALSSLAVAQVPVRKASKNGTNGSQPSMNLFGPTQFLSKSGGDAGVAVQYICPGLDVADSNPLNFNDADPNFPDTLKLAGSCASGLYKFLFQVQPTKNLRNVTFTISNLVGFTPGTDDIDPNPTYGVQVCDDTGFNTLELCTKLAPELLPAVTASVNAKHTKIAFTVKKLTPTTAPQGVDHEGQGLTFEVIVQQTPKQPIAVPQISVD